MHGADPGFPVAQRDEPGAQETGGGIVLFQGIDLRRLGAHAKNQDAALESFYIDDPDKNPSHGHDRRAPAHQGDGKGAAPDFQIRINVEDQREGDETEEEAQNEPAESSAEMPEILLVVHPDGEHREAEHGRECERLRQKHRQRIRQVFEIGPTQKHRHIEGDDQKQVLDQPQNQERAGHVMPEYPDHLRLLPTLRAASVL